MRSNRKHQNKYKENNKYNSLQQNLGKKKKKFFSLVGGFASRLLNARATLSAEMCTQTAL